MEKKIIVPTIVAVATLILLVFGATYAYFTVTSTNSFGTKELNATVEDMADAVVLKQIEEELSLNVTRVQMSEENQYTTYSTSGNWYPANIAELSVSGEGIYKCDYKVTVTKSSSSTENDLYKAVQDSGRCFDVLLNINSYRHPADDYLPGNYDFCKSNLFPVTYSDTIYNISKDNPKYIASNIQIWNNDKNQNYLKGKDITLTYSISDFECELSEPTGEYTDLTFYGGIEGHFNDLGYYIAEDESYLTSSSNTVKIPETFQGKDGVWYRVTSLGWLLAYDVQNVYLPKSLENVEAGAFSSSFELENVYFEGSETEWNALFTEYVGTGKDYESIFGYLYDCSTDSELNYLLNDFDVTLPTMHYNVIY